MQLLLTTKAIEAAIKASETGPSQVLPDSKTRGAGRLLLRAHRGSGLWQFRYAPTPNEDDKLALGHYARAPGRGGLTLAEARTKAADLSVLLREPETRNLRAGIEAREQAIRTAEQAARAATEAAERARVEASQHTLGALLGIYVGHLKNTGKASAATVARCLDKHVIRDRPELAAMPAGSVERRELAAMVRAVTESAPRSAEMLRSYVAAAYRLAIVAEGDPTAPAALIPFGIERNPVEGIKSTTAGTRDRTLTREELRLALGRMAGARSVCAHLLRACVLAGGQRPQQMARAKVKDYSAAEGALLLWDGKGQREEPRAHLLPLGPEGQAHIAAMVERARTLGTEYLFTSDGKEPVAMKVMSRWVAYTLVADMVKAGEVSEPFQAKDLRRTAETMQARAGFAKDLRAQLLSHGLTGVQTARYDRYDYVNEKRAALVRWEQLLRDEPESGGNVVVLDTRRAG